jgi:hypothetical protein
MSAMTTSQPDWERPITGGHQGVLFVCGLDVCKVYSWAIGARRARNMAAREARALRTVEAFDDVPAPRLRGVRRFKPESGVVMTRIQGREFGRIVRDHPEVKPEYMTQMARCTSPFIGTSRRRGYLPSRPPGLGKKFGRPARLMQRSPQTPCCSNLPKCQMVIGCAMATFTSRHHRGSRVTLRSSIGRARCGAILQPTSANLGS